MTPVTSGSPRKGFPLAVFIALLAFVTLMSLILMSLRFVLERNDSEESLRAGYEPVMLPKLSDFCLSSDADPDSCEIFQPDFGSAVLMAENALRTGNFARSEDILRSLLLFFPDSPTVEKLLGSVFYLSGRYADAERIYRTILKRDPGDSVSLNNCAMSQGMQGKYADAIENMKRVRVLEPESATADVNLAGLYSKTGNRPLARRYFESARKKLGGDLRNLTFDPCLRELLMESELHDQIPPLPSGPAGEEAKEVPK